MNSIYQRAERESRGRSIMRVALCVVSAASFFTLWNAMHPILLYGIARANLGDYRLYEATFIALSNRHPELMLRAEPENYDFGAWPTQYMYFWQCWTFATHGSAGAVVRRPSGDSTQAIGGSLIFDERLDFVGSVPTDLTGGPSPADRNGVDGLEIVSRTWGRDNYRSQICFVLQLKRGESRVIAVIEHSESNSRWSNPIWTNGDGDKQHELEFLSYTGAGGAPSWSSLLRLYWIGPNSMAYDGELPSNFKVWLAPEGGGVRVPEDQPVDAIARELIRRPETSPNPRE